MSRHRLIVSYTCCVYIQRILGFTSLMTTPSIPEEEEEMPRVDVCLFYFLISRYNLLLSVTIIC